LVKAKHRTEENALKALHKTEEAALRVQEKITKTPVDLDGKTVFHRGAEDSLHDEHVDIEYKKKLLHEKKNEEHRVRMDKLLVRIHKWRDVVYLRMEKCKEKQRRRRQEKFFRTQRLKKHLPDPVLRPSSNSSERSVSVSSGF